MTNPELAVAVLSYRDEPFLVEAVRSVLDQDVAVEVVVVNSGGGDPAQRLAAAGIDVSVTSFPQRLYAGAVRNAGIDLTRAPYLAFLAADCLAAPGWAAARLREHRAGADAVASVMDNAYPDSVAAWAALLLVHNRRLPATRVDQRVYYGLSYDRSLFEHFGRFREDLRAGEDTEFNGRFEGRRNTVLATDAVTGHRYPTEFRPMLADAFRRGRLQARLQGAIAGRRPRGFRVALRGPRNALASLMVSLRSPRPQRERLLRALPLAVAAGIVYSCGALTARAADPVERSSRLA